MIRIPKQFELFGDTITVEWVSDLAGKNGSRGEWRGNENKILLVDEKWRPHDYMVNTFLHELSHAILDKLGRNSSDEVLISGVAGLLHQFLKTAEYVENGKSIDIPVVASGVMVSIKSNEMLEK